MHTSVASEATAPDRDDRAAQLAFFRENSYVILPELLSVSEVAEINAAIDRDRQKNPYLWWFQGNPRCGCNLLLTEPVVDITFRKPAVMELLAPLMGDAFVFEESAVQITEPSDTEKPTAWHRDRDHWREHPYGLDYPQLIIYLTDVDETTHCFTFSPEPAGSEPLAREEQLETRGSFYLHGKAGTAILLNCAIFHGLTQRKTDNQRRTLQVYYGHPDREPINDATICPPRLWRDDPDPEVRRFYGKLNGMTRTLYAALGISTETASPLVNQDAEMALKPTTPEEQVAFFHEYGYVLIEDAVSSDYLDTLRQAVDRIEEAKLPSRNLLATDPVFEHLIDEHKGFPILEQLIGKDIQLLSMDLRTCPPNGGNMPWHADHPFFTPMVNTVNTALYLDNLTPDNGALRVVPKSHRGSFPLTEEERFAALPGEVVVTCPAGTMVVFSDALWHRTGQNVTDRPRRGIFTYYGHFWHKVCTFAENPQPFHQMKVYFEGKDPRRAQLLGRYLKGSEYNIYE